MSLTSVSFAPFQIISILLLHYPTPFRLNSRLNVSVQVSFLVSGLLFKHDHVLSVDTDNTKSYPTKGLQHLSQDEYDQETLPYSQTTAPPTGTHKSPVFP